MASQPTDPSRSRELTAATTIRSVGVMDELDPEMRRLVVAARVARLATVRPDASPHIVAMTFAVMGRSIVTAIDHKPKRTTQLQRLRNIEANPAASVLVDHYDDDWARLWWARADGTARIVAASDATDAVELLVAKYPPYRQRRPEGPVIVVTIDRWRAWAAA